MTVPRVVLNPRRARPFYGRHPWVYAGAVAEVQGDPADGDEVEVYSHGGNFIARGLYNSRSRIRIRLYSWETEQELNRDFFRQRLEQAIHLRRDILKFAVHSSQFTVSKSTNSANCELRTANSNACRLVFSEGDGLSGMTVDQYDRWLVVQFTGLGMARRRDMFAELLAELLQPEGIYLRTERGIGKLEGLELEDHLLWGKMPAEPVIVFENGSTPLTTHHSPLAGYRVEFLVNLAEGQKTGFYLDQRDNRRGIAGYATGRRVLDAFCYTGGFGLHAGLAGAREIIGVDVSEAAVALARQNAARNGISDRCTFLQADVFDYLQSAVQERQRFDLIVLDPPKFARAQHAVEDALRGYRRLQALALMLLEPNGILVTCCCSGLITMEMLEGVAAQVAAESRRTVQVLERRGQSADHPVSLSCLESYYLKCLVMRVL